MIKPVTYLQTDPQWKNHNYSAKGEKKTIGSSGCGPTAAAMVIATIKDKNVTPITTAEWSMSHGYKALNQGTYYTYFVPQLSAYGIQCRRLNNSSLYGQSSSAAHREALDALNMGNWVIACMGKGNWTSSGHFILLYGYENGTLSINDPASTAASRVKNTWTLFSKQVKYMWAVTVPDDLKDDFPCTQIASNASGAAYTRQQFIRDVQTAIGMNADGIANSQTLLRTITISKSKNSRHMAVKPIQKYLNAQGYGCGDADGIAGAKFDSAVRAYQLAHGCVSDGEITAKKNTWKTLLGLR